MQHIFNEQYPFFFFLNHIEIFPVVQHFIYSSHAVEQSLTMVALFRATGPVLFLVADRQKKICEALFLMAWEDMEPEKGSSSTRSWKNHSLNAEGPANVNVPFRDEWRKSKIKKTDVLGTGWADSGLPGVVWPAHAHLLPIPNCRLT